MSHFIRETSGKGIRIWGTYEPSDTQLIDKNITIQHWQYGQSDPVELPQDGYEVISSVDWWAYLSLKNHVPISPAPYPQFFNNARVLNFADKEGWQWTPQLFKPVNITEQPEQKAIRGAILAAWKDSGPYANTQLESYYAIRNGIPVVASHAWTGSRGPRLDEAGLEEGIEILTSNAVGENLDRKISRKKSSRGPLISWSKPRTNKVQDQIALGYGSKGMNYTLQLNVEGPFSLESNDTVLSLTETGQLTFTSDGWLYPPRSVAEGNGFDPAAIGRIWVNATS